MDISMDVNVNKALLPLRSREVDEKEDENAGDGIAEIEALMSAGDTDKTTMTLRETRVDQQKIRSTRTVP
jgi:hypothetical protein